MERIIETVFYFYIYDNDQEDMVWYSPSSSDDAKCRQNLLNCIEEARRILRRNPAADIEICEHYCDMCDGYEYGDEGTNMICIPKDFDELEQKIRKEMRK